LLACDRLGYKMLYVAAAAQPSFCKTYLGSEGSVALPTVLPLLQSDLSCM